MRPEEVRRSGRKFRGFRAWTLDGYRLRSANPAGGFWTAGVNKAECRRSAYDRVAPLPPLWPVAAGGEGRQGRSVHQAPHPGCRCGLYAWHRASDLGRFPVHGDELVYGVVLSWGRIEVHPDGLRAQYAEPVVLAFDEGQSYRHVRHVQAISSELGIPTVELEDLDETARAYGEPVPDELMPGRMPPFEADPRWLLPVAASVLVATAGLIGGLKQAQRRAGAATPGSRPESGSPPSTGPR